MSTIYAPTLGTAASSPSLYQSTAFGGSDAPKAGYPEWASSEAIKVVAGAGPGGINVLDVDTSGAEDASSSGIALLGMGSLAGGQWDGTQGCITWKQYLSTAYVAQCFGGPIFLVITCGTGGTGGLFNADTALSIELGFDAPDLLEVFFPVFGTPIPTLSMPLTPDDAWHDMKLEWRCCVPNGGYTDGDTSGFVRFTVDSTVIEQTGIKLYMSSPFGPNTNNIRGIWFGYFGLAGPVGGITVRDALCTSFTAPPDASPSIPTVECKPTTTVLSTPSRQAGCKQGGTGWTQTYATSSPSGTVPVGADPVDGETLTGKSGVHLWTEITHTIYPAGTVQETLRYAMTELDDATRKEGRLRSVGDVEYALSDAQGNLQAGTVDVTISDVVGRPIGSRMVDDTKKYFQRDEIAVFCLSDAGRRASATARRLGRGLLQDDTYRTPIEAQFSGIDPFFCDGGAFGPDKKFPMWTIPTYYINAPVDVYAKALPIIFGEVSDEGAIDPVTNLPSARGLCPLTFVGMDGLATGTAGAAEQWGRFNVCVNASYQIIALYGSNLGGGLYGTAGATSNGATPSAITLTGSPDLSDVAVDGSVTMTLYTAKGRQTSQITAISGSTVTLNNTIAAVDAIAVDWIIGEAQPTRVKIDLATRNGQDCMVFGYPNYVRTTNYEDIMGSDGEVYRVTDVWVRGPLLDDHLAGIVTLAANVIGIEDVGDGTGLPITDYFTAYNWFLENCVVYNGKGGLSPAADGDLHTYADGTYIVKGSTFVDAQATTVTNFSPDGFKVGAYFGDQISLRDAIQLWNDNGGCRLGINEHGQVFVWLLDRLADTSVWPRIEHVSRVFGDVVRTHPQDEIENVVRGQCDWDADAQRYRNPLTQLVSTTGVLHNKTIRKYSKTIDGKLTRDLAQFTYVLTQRRDYAQDGPSYVTLTGDVGLMDYGIGTGIQFTSVMGPGALGYVDQPLVILGKRLLVESHLVTLTCLDVGDLVVPPADAFTLDDEGASPRTLGDETSTTAFVLV